MGAVSEAQGTEVEGRSEGRVPEGATRRCIITLARFHLVETNETMSLNIFHCTLPEH